MKLEAADSSTTDRWGSTRSSSAVTQRLEPNTFVERDHDGIWDHRIRTFQVFSDLSNLRQDLGPLLPTNFSLVLSEDSRDSANEYTSFPSAAKLYRTRLDPCRISNAGNLIRRCSGLRSVVKALVAHQGPVGTPTTVYRENLAIVARSIHAHSASAPCHSSRSIDCWSGRHNEAAAARMTSAVIPLDSCDAQAHCKAQLQMKFCRSALP